MEALSIEPYCVEANFNLGLAQLRLDDAEVGVAISAGDLVFPGSCFWVMWHAFWRWVE